MADANRTAVAVQPNISETAEWTATSAEEMRQRLLTLSLTAFLNSAAGKPELILWPEVPAPIYYESDPQFRESVSQLVRTTRTHFLFGTVSHTENGAPLNSAAMVAPDGRMIGRYDKVNLVPFGEYVPRLFGFVNKVSTEAGDFAGGSRIVNFPLNGSTIGAFICYESAFPHFVRQFSQNGATVLANLSNDGYFGDRAARDQHLLIVRMRAAENRRWILRATNDGITASIDPAGRLRAVWPSWTPMADRLPFSHEQSRTLYSQYGDWFAWTCLILGLALALLAYIPEFQRVKST
jgi:apolipoprotein N-acyltransferase